MIKSPVKAATTANIMLSGTQTIDGVVLVVGNRVLVKNQNNGSQNGIYEVSDGAWSRSSDANTDAEIMTGLSVAVENGGRANGGSTWQLGVQGKIFVGTTALSFRSV